MGRPRTFNKDDIARRAMELFWERGYGGAASATIFQRVGLGAGSIYQAYGSKEGLYRAALAQYEQRGARILQDALSDQDSVCEALRTFLIRRLEEALTDPLQRGCLLVNTIGERLPADPVASMFAREMQQANIEAIATAMLRAVSLGELKPNTDAHALAAYLVTVMNGIMVAVKIPSQQGDLRRTVDLAMTVIDAYRVQEPVVASRP